MVRNANLTPLGEPEIGAEAEVYFAISPKLNNVTGKYFNEKTESKADSEAYNKESRKRLWELSVKLTKLR
jgi:hypothetical protein